MHISSISVVEDHNILRQALMDGLQDLGLKVSDFANGQDLLTSTNRDSLDFILCDVHMPVMDGLDMLKQLRNLGDPTPVLI